MGRAARVEFDGAFYHVMCRGVARMPVFLDDDDRQRFLAGVGELVEGGDLEVCAFCLMPNRFHLLCSKPCGRLSQWMRHISGDYARWFNGVHHRGGHLWQGLWVGCCSMQ